MVSRRVLPSLLVVVAVVACGGGDDDTATGSTPVIDPGDGGEYEPGLSPQDVVDAIDNPYLPFAPGSRWVYEGESDGEIEHIEVVVQDATREVMGIDAVVVRDTVTVDGAVVEDTFDWYAQDRAGNVWYLGEDVSNYEDGEVVDHEGSWEAGVDGAQPGVVMPAAPAVGQVYRQEYLAGEAEDMGEVLALDGDVEVPAGAFADVVTTRDWTPLEPDVVEEKDYAPGVGLVRERAVGEPGAVELLTFTPGPAG